MTNKQTASDILNRYWDGLLIVDPFKIALKMDIDLRTLGREDLNTHSGYYDFNNGNPIIYFNPLEPTVRQRFTVAHELGHHVNGDKKAPRDTYFDANSHQPIEVAANKFAAELLMPKDILKFAIEKQKISYISELAELFGVSNTAMTYRLKNLGYISS